MSTGAQSKAVVAGQHADGPRLLADVGGTNARFALETGPGEITQIRVYPGADYPTLTDAIRKYLKDVKIARVNHAAIAIANPVDGDQVTMTNHDWSFSIEATRRALGFDTLLVVNDFTALAMALPGLTDAQRVQIGGGTRRQNSVIGLLGPGTGLGVSGLIPADDRWIALGSEGGHASFAPQDEREDLVLQYARKKFPHVSFERVCAGPGIEIIYRALAARDKRVAASVDTADIVERAHAGEALALETVECFCGILGSFAGSVALTLGALGGVYIGGGVALKLGELFTRSSFRALRGEGPLRALSAEHPDLPDHRRISGVPRRVGDPRGAVVEPLGRCVVGGVRADSPDARRADAGRAPRRRSRAEPSALDHQRPDRRYRAQGRREPADGDPLLPLARLPGLSDFKLKLATGLTGTIPMSHSQVHLGDTATDFGAKVLDNTVSAILQLREHLNFEHVENAIEILNGARRIEFYGLGNSNIVAQDAHYKFFRFGIPTIAYGDLYMQAASAALLGKGDVIVAVSKSGRAPELLRVLDVAMQAGAKVIAITSSNTPLAKRATVALETDHIEMRESQLSMISRILHLVMIDILAVGVAIRRASTAGELPEAVAQARARASDDETADVLDWLSHGASPAAKDVARD
jgi:glucokinase